MKKGLGLKRYLGETRLKINVPTYNQFLQDAEASYFFDLSFPHIKILFSRVRNFSISSVSMSTYIMFFSSISEHKMYILVRNGLQVPRLEIQKSQLIYPRQCVCLCIFFVNARTYQGLSFLSCEKNGRVLLFSAHLPCGVTMFCPSSQARGTQRYGTKYSLCLKIWIGLTRTYLACSQYGTNEIPSMDVCDVCVTSRPCLLG